MKILIIILILNDYETEKKINLQKEQYLRSDIVEKCNEIKISCSSQKNEFVEETFDFRKLSFFNSELRAEKFVARLLENLKSSYILRSMFNVSARPTNVEWNVLLEELKDANIIALTTKNGGYIISSKK